METPQSGMREIYNHKDDVVRCHQSLWVDEAVLCYIENWSRNKRLGLLFATDVPSYLPDSVRAQAKDAPFDAPIRCRCGSSTFVIRTTDDYETSAFCSQCECHDVVHSG